MQQNVEKEVIKQFSEQYKKGDIKTGKNLIVFNVAQQYVNSFLKQEIKLLESGKKIIIREIETDLKVLLKIEELNFPVYLTGKVDRVDEVDGVIRIIDYKTGRVEQREVSVDTWEDFTVDYKKYSKPFQILAYAYMMNEKNSFTKPVEGGIISFKNLKNGFIKFKEGKSSLIDNNVLDKFFNELKQLILEICNINIPFTEKEI